MIYLRIYGSFGLWNPPLSPFLHPRERMQSLVLHCCCPPSLLAARRPHLQSQKRKSGRFPSIKDVHRLGITTRCGEGESRDSAEVSRPERDALQSLPTTGATLLCLGFFLGPILDGIHSNVELIAYRRGEISIGALHTDVVVPPLLGVFYSVVGLLQLALDKLVAPKKWRSKSSFKRVVFSLIFLIIILEASAIMFKAGTPYNIEAYALFALAEINWLLFDATWWGFGLATVVGVICPLCEIPLMRFFDFWHYSKPNVEVFGEGSVTWVIACYFAYVPFLANVARWLTTDHDPEKSE